ncbi:MAG: clan AA aspartic protease [Planctomycetota bacterium]
MQGIVDSSGRSLLAVKIQSPAEPEPAEIDVWIDTGFTGDLVIPRSLVEKLSLQQSGSVDAVLADGSHAELQTFSCVIEWFGTQRKLEVIANDGEFPLLGVGLLLGLELRIDYRDFQLTLNTAASGNV